MSDRHVRRQKAYRPPDDLRLRLEAYAAASGRTEQEIVIQALEQYLADVVTRSY